MGKRNLAALAIVVIGLASLPSFAVAASSWVLQHAPRVEQDGDEALNDVSCSSTRSCIAVGYYVHTSRNFDQPDFSLPLTERWDGTRWSVLPAPTPEGATTTGMASVSCLGTQDCIALGNSSTQQVRSLLLVERWNGTSWSIQTLPPPSGAQPDSETLSAISCRSTGCTAVGSYRDSSKKMAALAERWNGTSWSLQRPAKPRHAKSFWFEQVSCAGSRACMALGIYTGGHRFHPLVESWNGHAWSIRPGPAVKRRPGYGGLSCTSSQFCIDVGATNVIFAERWDGRAWSRQTLAKPPGTLDSRLDAVWCVSANACTAVGSGETAGDLRQGTGSVALAGRWNGRGWSWQKTRNPGDKLDGGQNEFNAVSCPTPSVCFAAGQDQSTRGNPLDPLIERWRPYRASAISGTNSGPPNPPREAAL